MADDNKERARALEMAVGQIEKQFGKGSIMRLGQKDAVATIASIPTGSISIDFALGVGGMPRGRVIEIYGPESSGKTTLALQVVAQAQARGGMAAFVDAGNAYIRTLRDYWVARTELDLLLSGRMASPGSGSTD